eukprot:2133496-Pleurochrysis_carterae.AAC.1
MDRLIESQEGGARGDGERACGGEQGSNGAGAQRPADVNSDPRRQRCACPLMRQVQHVGPDGQVSVHRSQCEREDGGAQAGLSEQ